MRLIVCSFFLFFIITNPSFAQTKSEINLPEGGKEVLSNSNLIRIYITKNQDVFSEDGRFRHFDDISNFIINKIEWYDFPKIELYADKEVPFNFIDKIKQEIASVNKGLRLMTKGVSSTKFSIWTLLFSYNNIEKNPKIIPTLAQELRNKELNEGSLPPPPPPPLPMATAWYFDLAATMYSGDKTKIEAALETLKWSSLHLTKDQGLTHNNEKLNAKTLKRLLKEYKILFLTFDEDLIYNNYIVALNNIRNSQYELEQAAIEVVSPIEISIKLTKELKEKNIKL